jgi:hypothetical protein
VLNGRSKREGRQRRPCAAECLIDRGRCGDGGPTRQKLSSSVSRSTCWIEKQIGSGLRSRLERYGIWAVIIHPAQRLARRWLL